MEILSLVGAEKWLLLASLAAGLLIVVATVSEVGAGIIAVIVATRMGVLLWMSSRLMKRMATT